MPMPKSDETMQPHSARSRTLPQHLRRDALALELIAPGVAYRVRAAALEIEHCHGEHADPRAAKPQAPAPPDSLVEAIDAYVDGSGFGKAPGVAPALSRIFSILATVPGWAVAHRGLTFSGSIELGSSPHGSTIPSAESVDQGRATEHAERGWSAEKIAVFSRDPWPPQTPLESLAWVFDGLAVSGKDRDDARRMAATARSLADRMEAIDSFIPAAKFAGEKRREAELFELLADVGDAMQTMGATGARLCRR